MWRKETTQTGYVLVPGGGRKWTVGILHPSTKDKKGGGGRVRGVYFLTTRKELDKFGCEYFCV